MNRYLITRIRTETDSIYLTFDDGPDKQTTPEILDILKRYDAKATFFCLGKKAEAYPDLLQRIKDEGHVFGNHTYSHLRGKETNTATYLRDVRKCEAFISTSFFRPPYGSYKKEQLEELKDNYKIILWTVMPGDFDEKVSKETVLRRSVRYSEKGTIIVYHDSEKASEKVLYVLPRFLDHFSKKGFTFEPLKKELI